MPTVRVWAIALNIIYFTVWSVGWPYTENVTFSYTYIIHDYCKCTVYLHTLCVFVCVYLCVHVLHMHVHILCICICICTYICPSCHLRRSVPCPDNPVWSVGLCNCMYIFNILQLLRLKSDLKDVLYSHKWTPDAYLLAKAYVASDAPQEG